MTNKLVAWSRPLMLWPLCFANPLWAASPPNVIIDTGTIRGAEIANGGSVFKGIPYAAPPIGPLRWAPPAAVAPWQGVRDATSVGHACTQPDQGWNSAPAKDGNEDCLYLNVWTPKQNGTRLPVMVWIHGGAFVGGSGSESLFSGENFTARGVVLVTINYRLGVFGFLAHPDLTAASSDKASGNYGLRDQIAALKWVHANIAHFGGDPANITLFGQSAGGGSVINLLTSPLSKGIAKQAIVESGAALRAIQTPKLADAEARGTRFADGAPIELLRELSTVEIMQRFGVFAQQGPQNQVGPIVDGYALTDEPPALFAKGQQQKVPLIIGNNAREGFGRMPDTAVRAAIEKAYGSNAPAALREYGIDGATIPPVDPVFGGVAAIWATDTSFRCGAAITASRHAATGAPTYQYQFEQSLPGKEAEGAQHSFELPFVFGNLFSDGVFGGAYTPADRALSNTLLTYWTNFAKTGDPNGNGVATWHKFDAAKRSYVHLSTRYDGNVKADQGLRKNACQLYEQSLEQGIR